jgi:predicted secreted protein
MKNIIIVILIVIILIVTYFVIKNNFPKNLELIYKSNGGVPFRWEIEINDESIVTLADSYVVKNENTGAKVGAPIYTKYVFKGLKEGMTTIIFRYVSITDERIDKEEKYNVKVDANNNIYLIN